MSTQVSTQEIGNGFPTVDATAPAKREGTDRRKLWVILSLFCVYVIWGTTYLGISFALESFPPYLMMGIRFVIAGGGLFAFLRLRGAPMPTLSQWRSGAIVGLLLIVGGMGSVAMAEQWVSSGLAATLVATAPVWAMLFSIFWKNYPTRREWIGVVFGIAGVALLTLEKNLQANPLGIALIIFATISWSLGSVWSRYLDMPKGAMGNALEMLTGGIVLVLMGIAFGERITTVPTPKALLALIYLITIGSLVALTAYMYLLKTVSPSLATSYAFVNPAIALLLGIAFNGETLSGSALIALPIILLGLGFVAFKKKSSIPAEA
jgi:drug/metabolite transporter (DMT)-like permease